MLSRSGRRRFRWDDWESRASSPRSPLFSPLSAQATSPAARLPSMGAGSRRRGRHYQEVFVRTHRQLDQYRSDGPLEAWLYRITRRAATQMRRKSKRRGRLALSPGAQPLRDVYTTDPGGRVDRERAASIIRELFSNLPQRQREIFDLVDLQGLSPAEVAERTGMKPVSVRANLFKARKTIRENLLATHPSYSELSR